MLAGCTESSETNAYTVVISLRRSLFTVWATICHAKSGVRGRGQFLELTGVTLEIIKTHMLFRYRLFLAYAFLIFPTDINALIYIYRMMFTFKKEKNEHCMHDCMNIKHNSTCMFSTSKCSLRINPNFTQPGIFIIQRSSKVLTHNPDISLLEEITFLLLVTWRSAFIRTIFSSTRDIKRMKESKARNFWLFFF